MFVLTNKKNYLMYNAVNKLVATTQEKDAVHFVTREKATNALNNLPKTLAHLGYQVEAAGEDEELASDVDAVSKDTPTELVSNFPQFEELCDFIKEFEHMYFHMISSKPRLEKELEQYEDEQQDIIHAIEFRARNASDGYKMYKKLHELRNNRRKIKDSLLVIEILEDTFGDKITNCFVSDRLKGMKKRKYMPRRNKEIFLDKL